MVLQHLQKLEVGKTASYVTKYVTKEMQNSIVEKGKKKILAISWTEKTRHYFY